MPRSEISDVRLCHLFLFSSYSSLHLSSPQTIFCNGIAACVGNANLVWVSCDTALGDLVISQSGAVTEAHSPQDVLGFGFTDHPVLIHNLIFGLRVLDRSPSTVTVILVGGRLSLPALLNEVTSSGNALLVFIVFAFVYCPQSCHLNYVQCSVRTYHSRLTQVSPCMTHTSRPRMDNLSSIAWLWITDLHTILDMIYPVLS